MGADKKDHPLTSRKEEELPLHGDFDVCEGKKKKEKNKMRVMPSLNVPISKEASSQHNIEKKK